MCGAQVLRAVDLSLLYCLDILPISWAGRYCRRVGGFLGWEEAAVSGAPMLQAALTPLS